jgi:hypothetical protein
LNYLYPAGWKATDGFFGLIKISGLLTLAQYLAGWNRPQTKYGFFDFIKLSGLLTLPLYPAGWQSTEIKIQNFGLY